MGPLCESICISCRIPLWGIPFWGSFQAALSKAVCSVTPLLYRVTGHCVMVNPSSPLPGLPGHTFCACSPAAQLLAYAGSKAGAQAWVHWPHDYSRMLITRATHKAVPCVLATLPWPMENTIHAVCATPHELSWAQRTAVKHAQHCLAKTDVWEGGP